MFFSKETSIFITVLEASWSLFSRGVMHLLTTFSFSFSFSFLLSPLEYFAGH
jgi:hypothetical protein